MSADHFTVDGTLIEAWASLKSFKKKGDDDKTPPDDPGNPTVDFHGEKRSNDTHESTTDPDAKLARKGKGKEAKLSYSAHALIENRNGLVVDLQMDVADGHAERRNAAGDARQQPAGPAPHHRRRRQGLRHERLRRGLPRAQRHAARRAEHHASGEARTSTSARPGTLGYAISQRVRKRIEEVFGWIKTVGNFRKTPQRPRGAARAGG